MKSGICANLSKKEKASLTFHKLLGKSRASVKNKLYNLGLSLKDNTQPQIPLAVSSSPSSSSKSPIAYPTSPTDVVSPTEASLELKRTGPLPSVEEKLKVMDAALVALARPCQLRFVSLWIQIKLS